MLSKYSVLGAALVGLTLSLTQPALAENQPQQEIDELQKQIQGLQKQLQSIQNQMTAQQAATRQVQAQVQAAPIKGPPPGAEVVYVNPDNGGIKVGPVTFKMGGFIEMDGVFRSRNETSDVGSTFGGIPFQNVPSAHMTEFRGSARGSRLSLLALYDWNAETKLSAYYESDLLGTGVTSNSGESNSYVWRTRQAYLSVQQANGWSVEAGQAWSLVTGFKDGLVLRDENIPLVLDHQYLPGFNWRRDPQIRITKTFSPAFSVGLSAESPQANFFTNDLPPVSELVEVVPGTGSGGGTFNNGVCFKTPSNLLTNLGTTNCANYSADVAPDMVLKAAFDPGWGHYEVFGLGRLFQTRATDNLAQLPKAADNNVALGGGIGGNFILPIIPKKLDVQASVLGGEGIGQYGAAQFQDATVNKSGNPIPIKMIQTMGGAVAHLTPALDVFFYGGIEIADSATFNVDGMNGTPFGFGSPFDNNTGCHLEGSSNCKGVNKDVWQLTGGLWDKIYDSKWGRVMAGLQYSYTQRQLFDAIGGGPTANDNMVFASLRYYPFTH